MRRRPHTVIIVKRSVIETILVVLASIEKDELRYANEHHVHDGF